MQEGNSDCSLARLQTDKVYSRIGATACKNSVVCCLLLSLLGRVTIL